jgi:glutathione S-transferase
MKLYYSPGACSLGIHVLLEEVGVPFEREQINIRSGKQHSPEFQSINPKSKVPALVRDDGSLLTEFPAIAFWLAHSFPDAQLIPADLEGKTRVLEALEFIVSSIHMRGVTFILASKKFVPDESGQQALAIHGRSVAEKGLAQMSETLRDKDYLLGDYSIADAALFYVMQWAKMLNLSVPANLDAFHQTMLARPAVQRALEAEKQA